MKPPRSILDKSFTYRNAASTDIRETFERIRREQKAKEEQEQRNAAEAERKTIALRRSK